MQDQQQLKADFDRDGYVIVRQFVPPDQVREICRRAEDATRDLPRKGPFSNVTKGMERLDGYFDDLLRTGPHVTLLGMLMGRAPEPTTASFFTKVQNDQQVHPHSDALDGGVIWIALDPSSPENGCLHFLKGSHHFEADFAHLKADEPTDLSEHPDGAEARMDPGDIAFFKPTTVHWSGPNSDGSPRRGFNCFYVGNPRARASRSK
jgi:phytanoyl-CoA hydroxylase